MTLYVMLGVALVASMCLLSQEIRASDAKATTILVPDMDCGGCAKKLAKELSKVAGVAKVEPDLEAKTIKVTPKANSTVSPKSLWEAVETAGKMPTKLDGPSGSFSEKPSK